MSEFPIIAGLHTLAPRYEALICDVWGVIHNGRNAYDSAVDCLIKFRRQRNGIVLLLSNAPRPSAPIREQLLSFGVGPDAYDTIVTSGDLTRVLLKEKSAGRTFKIHHVGPDRDLPLFEGIDLARVTLNQAQAIVCTGPFDDTKEGPDDYRDYWHQALDRRIPFFCANPDLQVQRGDHLIFCAGALAQDYQRQGGEVIYLGKPHLPVYDFVARHLKSSIGRDIPRAQWLAIGDGLKTDIQGATSAGLDALLITGGIHEQQLCDGIVKPDPAKIASTLKSQNLKAIAAMHRLAW